jgi:high-affinity iron transporter
MLINTVILFLRDALPLFVLLGMLIGQVAVTKSLLFGALLLGFFCSLVFIQQVGVLGELFAGTGLEVSLWALHFLLYGGVLLLGFGLFIRPASYLNHHQSWLVLVLLVIIIVAKGTNFLLYFNGFLNQQNALQSMLIGTLLGLGICLSLAILLYFFTVWLKRQFGPFASWAILLIFITGQLTNSLNLLVQVDVIPEGVPLWNSQWLVDNESEYGHLLNVLFGYIATPTALQVSLYISLIFLPLLTRYLWLKFIAHTDRGENQ